MIVVQRVVTAWTKLSRGAPGSVRRNAVAEAFPLPPQGRDEVLVHRVLAQEEDGFAAGQGSASHTLPASAPLRLDTVAGIRLEAVDGRLHVIGVADAWCQCVTVYPRRPLRTMMRLAAGEWGRWRLNFRLWDGFEGSEWRYQKWVVNVAHLTRWPERDPFQSAAPDRLVDDMVQLTHPTRWRERRLAAPHRHTGPAVSPDR